MSAAKKKSAKKQQAGPLKMTKTISARELNELRERYFSMQRQAEVYKATEAYYKTWEREIARINGLPETFTININTGVVSWEQAQDGG